LPPGAKQTGSLKAASVGGLIVQLSECVNARVGKHFIPSPFASPVLENGGPFFREGGHSFLLVLECEHGMEHSSLEAQPL
jgi:hypothetical protein